LRNRMQRGASACNTHVLRLRGKTQLTGSGWREFVELAAVAPRFRESPPTPWTQNSTVACCCCCYFPSVQSLIHMLVYDSPLLNCGRNNSGTATSTAKKRCR
jgi:hypothetical protein